MRRRVTTGGWSRESAPQLQNQTASNRTTVQVTGLLGPTMNCITELFLRLIMFPSNKCGCVMRRAAALMMINEK